MRTPHLIYKCLFLILLLGITIGCIGGAPVSSPNGVETMVAATLQALTSVVPTSALLSLPTATTTPSLTPMPSSTSAPLPTATVQAVPSATRLNFKKGATFTTVDGSLQTGQSFTFVLGAAQSQPIIVNVDSINHDVTFSLVGQNGATLVNDAQKLSSWQGLLPATQDYYLKVNGGANAGNYTLSVIIASRIQFASGATSSKVTGTTTDGYIVSYVVRASQGQTMNINLTVPAGDGALQVWGFQDGQPYLRYVAESAAFNMVLPATEDYMVEVVPRAGMVIDYSMTVDIK
jgi:hypothetical protein